MKCPYCGKELLDGAEQCDGCGVRFNVGSQVNQNPYNNVSPIQNNFQQTSNNQQPNKGNKTGIIIIVLFILIIGVVSFFLFFNGSGKDNSNNNASNNVQRDNNENKENNENNNVIINSRKIAYLDTAKMYVYAIRNEVNMGMNIQLFTNNTLLLIPVGGNSYCGKLESGGSSPFSNGWNYAYVGVTYDGNGYSYYFISEDDKTNGIPFVAYNKLVDEDITIIYDKHNDVITNEVANKLKELYSVESNTTLDENTVELLKNVLVTQDRISKYVVLSSKAGCKY